MPLYQRPNSEVWWADVAHEGRRVRRSTGTTDRREAEKEELRIKLALLNAPVALKGHTWQNACIQWITARERGEADLLDLAKFNRLYPDRLLRDITGESIEKTLNFCKAPGTYTRYRAVILSILNMARKKEWIDRAPNITTRKVVDRPRDWLTRPQWHKLYAELPSHMKPMARFAIETGLRQSNVLQLTWDRISLERRLVWIEAEDAKGKRAFAVPLNRSAHHVLRHQPRGSEFVFTYRGRPISEVKTAFQAACVRAGVGRYVGGKYNGFTWHGFRHTWATWHVQNSTPVDVLQKLGGWADLRMVLKYAHHSAGHLASFADNTRRGTP